MAASTTPNGPIENEAWPEHLRAHVIEPGVDPRVHGYASQADLALNYGFSDLVLLVATGELPDARHARALEVVLTFLAPISVAEAPAHAASLARLCGATSSATLAVAAIALAEQARYILDQHAELLAWLEAPDSGFPSRHRAPQDAEAVARLAAALSPSQLEVTALTREPSLSAALLATLFAVGLRRRELLELALVLARLPAAVAEAGHIAPLAFRDYPMNTPRFRYEFNR